jgi:hypothetical protein
MENRNRLYTTLEFHVATPVAPSARAEEAVALLQSIGVADAAIVGRAPALTAKRLVGDWTFMPWDQDTCQLPPMAWQSMIALTQASIPPDGWALGHEPKKVREDVLRPAKARVVSAWTTVKTQWKKFQTAATPVAQQAAVTTKQWAVAAAPVALDFSKVVLKTTVVAAGALGMIALCSLGLMGSLLLADPILYALFPADDGGDPVWVICARWKA